MALDPSTLRSRRAILAAAAGAAAATVVGAVTKPTTVRAAGDDGSIMHIGDFYADARSQTTWANQANDNIVLWVASNADSGGGGGAALVGFSDHGVGVSGGSGTTPILSGGIGVAGTSDSGVGVSGTSGSGSAVKGVSTNYYGVFGSSSTHVGINGESSLSTGVVGSSLSSGQAAMIGLSSGGSTGVQGVSGNSGLPVARPQTGVFGYANQSSTSKGVVGQSSKGYAGYFLGKVYTNKFHEMQEISTPNAPAANKARLFLKDNGSGKTQLCVRFHSGAVQVLSTQP
jgi:hypothetical protein